MELSHLWNYRAIFPYVSLQDSWVLYQPAVSLPGTTYRGVRKAIYLSTHLQLVLSTP